MGYGTTSTDDVDSRRKSHMMKVHCWVLWGLGCAGTGTYLHSHRTKDTWLLQGSDAMSIVQVVCMFLMAFLTYSTNNDGVNPIKAILYTIIFTAAGLNTGTWLEHAAQESGMCKGAGWQFLPDIDYFKEWDVVAGQANPCQDFNAVAVSVICVIFSVYLIFLTTAAVTPRGSMQFIAPFVSCALFIGSMGYWLARTGLLSTHWGIDVLYVQMGLLAYLTRMFMDLSEIYDDVDKGNCDVINHALRIGMNLLHIFIRVMKIVVQIIANSNGKKKK